MPVVGLRARLEVRVGKKGGIREMKTEGVNRAKNTLARGRDHRKHTS